MSNPSVPKYSTRKPSRMLPRETRHACLCQRLMLSLRPRYEVSVFSKISLILRSQKIKYVGWWTWKTLHFENRSFRQDRPQKFRLKYQGARDVILRKSIFSSRSPPRNFVLNISTSPPTARSAENFYMLKCFLPCERIFPHWKLTFSPSCSRLGKLTSSPSARSAEMFWNAIEQSFIFRLNDDFHQPRPQYALRIGIVCNRVRVAHIYIISLAWCCHVLVLGLRNPARIWSSGSQIRRKIKIKMDLHLLDLRGCRGKWSNDSSLHGGWLSLSALSSLGSPIDFAVNLVWFHSEVPRIWWVVLSLFDKKVFFLIKFVIFFLGTYFWLNFGFA